MKVGIAPPLALASFFAGDPPPRAAAGAAELALLSAAGGDPGTVWHALPADPAWGGWRTLLFVDEAPFSQYDGMIGQLRGGMPLPDRAAAVALTGRDFHGQRGRPWSAQRGNLHLVVHFAPRRPAAAIGLGCTLLPAVACVRAIRTLSGGTVAAGIKWVNDIVAAGRKLGGFLAHTQSQAGVVQDVVLGFGINVERTPEVAPTPFVPAAGCLREIDPALGLRALLPALLCELDALYAGLLAEGPAALLDAYREYAVVVGRRVRVWDETAGNETGPLRTVAPLASGRVEAIADDLSLVLSGHPEPVRRGRLAFEEDCARQGL